MKYAHVSGDGRTQSLRSHLNEVSDYTGIFAKKINLQKLGKVIGYLHDYGKLNPEFQKYLLSATGMILPGEEGYVDFTKLKGKIDHSTAGAQLLNEYDLPKEIKEIITILIVSHHGGLIDFISPDGELPLVKRLNKEIGLSDLKEITDDEFNIHLEELLGDSELISGFIEHVNLIKEVDNNQLRLFMIGMTVKFMFSALIDADRSDTINFEYPERASSTKNPNFHWESVIEAIEEKSESFKIRNSVDLYRKKISDECLRSADREPGIYRLTVPTGGGKTLSSLRFAASHARKHQMDRIIYIIPYTSIIDQNAQTVRELLLKKGLENILLEHHSNISDEEDTEFNRITSENWDSRIIYSTMVQFLETIFSGGTSSIRRFHNLANSVIIFDEVQTVSLKNIFLFNSALRYLHEICGSTIVLCTATQPVLDHENLSPYSLPLSHPSELSVGIDELETVFDRVEPVDLTVNNTWKIEDTGKLALDELQKNQSVLVIVNTKKAAKAIAKIFEENQIEYHHLSTNMCPTHRIKVIRSLNENLKSYQEGKCGPVLCISTQLIEAGVDIDFNVVIRHLSGLDSIVQAAGRCNRNGLMQSKGKLFIVNPVDEELSRLKDILEGKRCTERVLREIKLLDKAHNILSSKAIASYFMHYYYLRKDDMSYHVELSEFGVKDTILNLLSKNDKSVNALRRTITSEKVTFTHAIKTASKHFEAIDSKTKGIIVPFGEGEHLIKRLCATKDGMEISNLVKEAQRYSINLYDYQIRILYKENAIHETQANSGIYYLEKNYYSEKYGLDMDGSKLEVLIV